MTMRGHLSLVGKSLAAAGLTGIVLYVVGTATQSSWPFWPYYVFGVMVITGSLLYLLGENRPTQRPPQGDGQTEYEFDTLYDAQPRMAKGWDNFLAEVIMLRARSLDLADSVGAVPWKLDPRSGPPGTDQNRFYSPGNRALAQTLASDIDRLREAAGHSQIGRRLSPAKTIARELVAAINTPEVYRHWGQVRERPDVSEIADRLQRSLMQIPVDVSGLNMTMLRLRRLEALNGVVWTEDTCWPSDYIAEIHFNSRLLRNGVHQALFDSLQ